MISSNMRWICRHFHSRWSLSSRRVEREIDKSQPDLFSRNNFAIDKKNMTPCLALIAAVETKSNATT